MTPLSTHHRPQAGAANLGDAMKQARKKSSAKNETDAIKMLTEDHKKVKKLFAQFEKIKDDGNSDEKSELVKQICTELLIHTHLEEEIFYPAVREAIDEEDLIEEAEVEHNEVKQLIAELEDLEPGGDHYDAKVKVMGENVEHHVEEEEEEMFPAAKKAKVDTAELGARMMQRKQELEQNSSQLSAKSDTAA
jgi:hemerythrin superfamily protein